MVRHLLGIVRADRVFSRMCYRSDPTERCMINRFRRIGGQCPGAGNMKSLVLVSIYLSAVINAVPAEESLGSPLVVITWDYRDATNKAWHVLRRQGGSALDAIEASCSLCERQRCRKTVGYGGSPDESGETTLDAVIMDGVSMDVGGVAGLRRVKSAISVARKVLENTRHSLLGGELATNFAREMGFEVESLQTEESRKMWSDWRANSCQPNFWKNVVPDPRKSCGPYRFGDPIENEVENYASEVSEDNHDTIGVIAVDGNGHIAAGTSTNGARNKIAGRIGDSPIAGAGAYADQQVGAAAGTGDGDVMMRFLPSFLAVEEMRRGASPTNAAVTAVRRIAEHYPKFSGAVIALNKKGEYGAACHGLPSFPYFVANVELGQPTQNFVRCIDTKYSVMRSENYAN